MKNGILDRKRGGKKRGKTDISGEKTHINASKKNVLRDQDDSERKKRGRKLMVKRRERKAFRGRGKQKTVGPESQTSKTRGDHLGKEVGK